MANTVQISFRIHSELLSDLKRIAEEEDRSVSNLLNRIIRQYLTSKVKPETRAAEGEGERA